MSPELLGPSDLVDHDDWRGLTQDANLTKFWVWMSLLDMDVQAAQMSLHDYLAAKNAPVAHTNRVVDARMLHSAKSFICAVRRVARLLEDFSGLSERRGDFPLGTEKVVKTAWKKRKALLDTFTEPRNIIEHVSGEIRGKTQWFLVYWDRNQPDHLLSDVQGDGEDGQPQTTVRAGITADVLSKVLELRAEIVDGIHGLAKASAKT